MLRSSATRSLLLSCCHASAARAGGETSMIAATLQSGTSEGSPEGFPSHDAAGHAFATCQDRQRRESDAAAPGPSSTLHHSTPSYPRRWASAASGGVLHAMHMQPFAPMQPHLQHRHASSWAFWRSLTSPSAVTTTLEGDGMHFPLPESSHEAITAITQALEAVDKAGIAAAKTDAWPNVAWAMEAFSSVHNMGLPWWASIAAVNILIRLLMSPLVVVSQRASSKVVASNHNMLHAHKLQQALTSAKTQEEQARLQRILKEEVNKQNAKAAGMTALTIPAVMAANMVVFLSVFSATSSLMESKSPSLTMGGALWFSDLTVPDPYYGLPLICCLTTLALVEYGISMTGDQAPMGMQKQAAALKWFMRAMSFMFLPSAPYVSAGTQVLWVSNTLFAVAQGMLMRRDDFRKRVGLPTMGEMRRMSEQVAEVTQARAKPPTAAIALDTTAKDTYGRVMLLKEDPMAPRRKVQARGRA